MAFTEEGSWKVGPDSMYDLEFRSGKLTLKWQDKCFMELSVDEGDGPEDFEFDETDLMWMQCYKPWMAAVVQGRNTECSYFEDEASAKAFLKEKCSELEGAKVAFHLVRIDGSYYYEDCRADLGDKLDPTAF